MIALKVRDAQAAAETKDEKTVAGLLVALQTQHAVNNQNMNLLARYYENAPKADVEAFDQRRKELYAEAAAEWEKMGSPDLSHVTNTEKKEQEIVASWPASERQRYKELLDAASDTGHQWLFAHGARFYSHSEMVGNVLKSSDWQKIKKPEDQCASAIQAMLDSRRAAPAPACATLSTSGGSSE